MPKLISHDVEIQYQTFGDNTKPALIFSNSLGTQWSMWQAQIDALKDNFYIVCYDTRGHGSSSAPKGPYQLQQLGEDVIHLLDHLYIDKANFCGISMGGITGQWLALHHPQRFNKIIICNTAAKIGQEQAWTDRAKLVREQGLDPIAATAASRWFTESFIQNNPNIVTTLSQNLAQGSAEGYASCCEALAKADLREKLHEITVPILIIAGIQDPVTTVADGQFMLDRISKAKLFEIDASHISNIEQADSFNQQVLNFLQV